MRAIHRFRRVTTVAGTTCGRTGSKWASMATAAAASMLAFASGLGYSAEPMPDSDNGAVVDAAVAATTAAGRTPGTFGVTSSGAATYRIPLWTPPGVGSVELDLALVYNSRSGNGVLGQGWSLSGLSAITRCNRTMVQDGAPAAVTNTSADRYCLDGQQLKLVSGVYGGPDSVYATEIESFSRIVANGAAGNGPASFTVTSKNGLIYEYGSTVDSQVLGGASGTIRTWAMSRVRDRAATANGNSIAIAYLNEAQNGNYTNGATVWPPSLTRRRRRDRVRSIACRSLTRPGQQRIGPTPFSPGTSYRSRTSSTRSRSGTT